jgi:hypothetical protein
MQSTSRDPIAGIKGAESLQPALSGLGAPVSTDLNLRTSDNNLSRHKSFCHQM